MDLRRLLLIFVGLALFVLVLFGVFSYRIAQDAAQEQQISTLVFLAKEQANQIEHWMAQGLSFETFLHTKHDLGENLSYVILDNNGQVISLNGSEKLSSGLLGAVLINLQDNKHSGKIEFDKQSYIWAHYAMPAKNKQLVVFIKKDKFTEAYNINLGARLAVTGFIVIWIAVWGALIVFSHVSRKTKKLELARRRSDEQVRLLLNSTAEAIYGIDVRGNCTFCNPAALKMLGYRDDADLLGKNLHELIHHTKADGSPHPIDECTIGNVIRQGVGVHVEEDVFWRADGSFFPVEYRGHPIRYENQIVGAVVTFLDISEKLQAQQEMQKLSLVIEQASDAVFITDSEGIIQYINPAFESILGYDKEEIVGQHFNVVRADYHKKNQVHGDELWSQVMRGEIFSGARLNKRKDGEEFYAQEVVAPLKDTLNNVTHIVFSCKDITVQLEQEAKIQATIAEKQAAEQANREKSSFLANMSHELRTPLNAIIGYSEILQEEFAAENRLEASEDLKKIHTAGSHLLSVINDILDFSKIEAGKLELHYEEVDIVGFVHEIASIVAPIIEKNRNQFTLELAEDLDLIMTDVLRLRQCLFNLLSNASKFAQGNKVVLGVEKELRQGEPWIQFRVMDEGIGISQEKMHKLFKEFSQADSSTTRRFGGTGLGLTISRSLLRLMGGDIQLQSQLGKGSEFTISVPAFAQAKVFDQVRTG